MLGSLDYGVDYPSKVLFSAAHNTYTCTVLYDILRSHSRLKDGKARHGILKGVLYLD